MYKRQNSLQMSFSDPYVSRKLQKIASGRKKFLLTLDQLIDWRPIESTINQVYSKGHNVSGQAAYPGLLLFKMLLLGMWYSMSDESVEEHVNESILAMNFVGLKMEDEIPDHSTLSRFRTALTQAQAWDKVLAKVNKQLQKKGLQIVEGQMMVDATITQTPRMPRGDKPFELAQDRHEDDRSEEEQQKEEQHINKVKLVQKGVDDQARWLKKGNKTYFGYKGHMITDEDGMIHVVHTTSANVHDSKGVEELLLKEKSSVIETLLADKAYDTPAIRDLLDQHEIEAGIQYKAKVGQALNQEQKDFNKGVSQSRYIIERTFGSIKKWFGGGEARYVGQDKMHAQFVLLSIAYNLKRAHERRVTLDSYVL